MSWRGQLLSVLRVPHSPAEPPGSPPQVFRAAPNFFKLRMVRWALTQLTAVIGFLLALYFVGTNVTPRMPWWFAWFIHIGEVLGALALLFELTIGWVIVRLDYELRWYLVSDRAIRIREGITTIREKTVALANIQNIAIRQGPLQRFLGIADVEVNTAGGGGSSGPGEKKKGPSEPMHVAYFRGVDNAEAIRDLLREGVRRQRDAGLGDPDEPHAAHGVVATAASGDVREAMAMLLGEARALRRRVSS
jgi:membrane protein YdbS with pleckstrin-like domain